MRNSGVDFTIIRAAWFAQNFSEGYLRDPILAGVLPMPGGDIAEPIIDIDDIADVAVAAKPAADREVKKETRPPLMPEKRDASRCVPERKRARGIAARP